MTDPAVHRPIVIAGAGPVGLYSAFLLVRAGHPVVVLEQHPELAADMRASTFHPATLDLLAQGDLADALVAMGTPAARWQYMVHGTRQRAVFDLSVLSDLTAHPFRLQCEQFRLTRLIVERLRGEPLFDLRLGCTLTGIEDGPDGVTVQARDASGEVAFAGEWLIAADGGRSTIRKALGLRFEGGVFPRTSITLVLDHPFHDREPELLGVNYVWTERAHYSLMRIRDLWRFSYSPDPQQTVEEALSEPVAQAHLQAVFPRRQPYRILQRNYYTLQQRCLDDFRVGRVVFAGDAAHLNSPAGGMGMNSGIHDAHCLVEHLLPVLAGGDERLLDRYARRRRTIAREEVQRLSARNYRWHRETDPERRRAIWQRLQDIVNDPARMREFLLDSSMLRSRQRELEID
ncbi:MAG: NAD(P)-binding protein [Xanthomonadales bacterium]|nr:NAD(P)-binding protein [Xanthomonadales bacterium]NIN58357.1 NAD(P)-binding protein [Xanthomonadales bacterium]NIN73694.1 NAD(P)-binding protein [Xanthomonadales bacterium]NIO14489.1 NAD(P)-binding protein [Xanthomonadales bacterium]NIP10750.1 NAD(P)-binding protein [Xanthomonadales bacterium]